MALPDPNMHDGEEALNLIVDLNALSALESNLEGGYPKNCVYPFNRIAPEERVHRSCVNINPVFLGWTRFHRR